MRTVRRPDDVADSAMLGASRRLDRLGYEADLTPFNSDNGLTSEIKWAP